MTNFFSPVIVYSLLICFPLCCNICVVLFSIFRFVCHFFCKPHLDIIYSVFCFYFHSSCSTVKLFVLIDFNTLIYLSRDLNKKFNMHSWNHPRLFVGLVLLSLKAFSMFFRLFCVSIFCLVLWFSCPLMSKNILLISFVSLTQ